ncbi:hypothetical protein BU25DRAFT_489222 [Macroventuria anomochaeta]|uniref:Uncharacterized protein n=1 Tax=Macroventuria anomochaeta TaxID=301207 RepID=A0ACB6SAC1_9PLEO|nr:uncharacterized protein BU25DRAFT_489222 [Macroventuria anomochaeta]KAF2630462.1 hypothetical protein BU25DRAFT_489222 [Macroventuria anomochaeta]
MSVVIRTAQDVADNVGARIAHMTNRLLPPKHREHALENLRAFSVRNPKLASFLAAQTALAGLPILLFLAFAVATLIVSLVTCIILGVIAALVFTLFTTGFALLFVVPVVFIGSCTASIAFLWGLIGYLVLQRINGGETSVQPGTKVSDTLNELTDERLRDLVDRADADAQQERLAAKAEADYWYANYYDFAVNKVEKLQKELDLRNGKVLVEAELPQKRDPRVAYIVS